MSARRLIAGALLLCAAALPAACDTKGMSYGDPNSVIAVMSVERWDQISEDIYGILEETIVTVRDEKTFTVTYQEPYGENWSDLRRFRQMLFIGTLSDPWIQEALGESESPLSGPGIQQVRDVWSRDQLVTVIVVPGEGNEGLVDRLTQVRRLLDDQYRAYARERMYMSGVDSALADTLRAEAGFALTLPDVYRWVSQDSIFVFRNDNPDPSELIRQIAVTWMAPAATTLDAERILAWRADLVAGYYTEPQDFIAEGMTTTHVRVGGRDALEIRAQWRNPPERRWPAGGPLITRAVTCDEQDRTYLVDAWLYAPGKEKYEYMIQLETILDTFVCG